MALKDLDKEAEGFIDCIYDDLFDSYRLRLNWWVTFEISIKKFQLQALHRVIGRALKENK